MLAMNCLTPRRWSATVPAVDILKGVKEIMETQQEAVVAVDEKVDDLAPNPTETPPADDGTPPADDSGTATDTGTTNP
jgi:hypothetical protein